MVVPTLLPSPLAGASTASDAAANGERSKKKRRRQTSAATLRSSAPVLRVQGGETSDDDGEVPESVSKEELAARLHQMTTVRRAACACCSVADLVTTEGSEWRGLVHVLFSMRKVWKKLYAISLLKAPLRGGAAAQAEVAAALASVGIAADGEELNDGLRAPFVDNYTSDIEPSSVYNRDWPAICPSVDWLLEEVALFLLGARGVDERVFFKLAIRPTTVYVYELAYRRRTVAHGHDTLRSLEREYAELRNDDVMLWALSTRLGANNPRASKVLNECFHYMTQRQSNPETHLCLDLSLAVQQATRVIITDMREQTLTLEQGEERLCALLRRPAASVSFMDYLWPSRTGVEVPGRCIKWRGDTPYLASDGPQFESDFMSEHVSAAAPPFDNTYASPLTTTTLQSSPLAPPHDELDFIKTPFHSLFSQVLRTQYN